MNSQKYLGELSNEDGEVTTTTFETANPNTVSNLTDLTTESVEEEVNPINGEEPLAIPSAVIGVQIQYDLPILSSIILIREI